VSTTTIKLVGDAGYSHTGFWTAFSGSGDYPTGAGVSEYAFGGGGNFATADFLFSGLTPGSSCVLATTSGFNISAYNPTVLTEILDSDGTTVLASTTISEQVAAGSGVGDFPDAGGYWRPLNGGNPVTPSGTSLTVRLHHGDMPYYTLSNAAHLVETLPTSARRSGPSFIDGSPFRGMIL
jgi:hypothetical protein